MNEEKKQTLPEPPRLPPPQEQITVTNQPLIQELTESVKEYTGACEETLIGQKAMRSLMGGVADAVVTLPEAKNDVLSWNPETADLMAEKLTDVAHCHEGMCERIHEQVAALRRMSAAVVAIRDEALNEKG